MDSTVSLNPQDGLSLAEFKAYMEGYAAGATAACSRAIQIRIMQLKQQAAPPEPPKESSWQ